MDHFTLIQNKDESELSYYVQKALRQKFDKSGTTNSTATSTPQQSSSVSLLNDSKLEVKSPLTVFDNNGATNGEENHIHHSPQQQQCRIPELIHRTTMKDFPLRVRQINNTEIDSTTTTTIPIIDNNEDLQVYCDHTAKQLQINELRYEKFRNYYQSQQQPIRIRKIDDGKRSVELAKQRLEHFKTYLNNNNKNNDKNNQPSSNH